ncbi:Hypothetical protein F387_02041 [Wohlfahrtiimonas chitiniclastica SH04]|uniref:Helix-turn-helix domain-containing protein n=1 Tax=Wohlfahrtiimonas chitiniclastica SH04 TaxID=1261130 RepID=L8XWI2_9GAMM|nr:hypothetical protein [Wohlfahrtiimonas chitiniclastica]ELV07164.1 Hypothetical protein F387_02041 [Wohlfahrtiimonas chitiniclastica SH04]
MAIVSISEAARLTGKTRATIHRHINTGKLSKTKNDTGSIGIDTSELIRVYNIKIDTSDTCIDTVKIEQRDTDELNTLKIRLEVLEAENHHLKDHVDSLKQVMLMLEHREQKQEKSSSWLSRLFNK